MTTFDQAFDKLLGHEGGFSDHKDDPGGATMLGITEAVARANGYTGPMGQLTVAVAAKIYKQQYWDTVRADDLPPSIRYHVFDAAVNSGVGQATKWLQRAVGVPDDGRIGTVTINAVWAAPPDAVIRRMNANRLRFMTDLKNWPSFSRGWARRIADLLEA